jgi:serine/threonine protein phosphatase 1
LKQTGRVLRLGMAQFYGKERQGIKNLFRRKGGWYTLRMAGRTLIVGDIHGHYAELMRALENAHFDQGSDRLVFLGDYIDRGGESREVLDFVVGLDAVNPDRHVFLRGNHEDIVLLGLKGDVRALHAWLDNMVGYPTLESYHFDRKRLSSIGGRYHLDNRRLKTARDCVGFLLLVFPTSHLAFLEGTRHFFWLDDWHLSHAGLVKGKKLDDHQPSSFVWGDQQWHVTETVDGQPRVICGHWHQAEQPISLGSKRIILAHDDKVPILIYEEMVVVDGGGRRIDIPRKVRE